MKGFSDIYVIKQIQHAVDNNIPQYQTASLLGISTRYLRTLIKKISPDNPNCLVHKNKGKPALNKIDISIENEIKYLYETEFKDFNFKHFLNFLNEEKKIFISYSTLYRILSDNNILSPMHQHIKKKDNIHPIRPRRKNFGELLQIDASIHQWFKGNSLKYALHGAIDDATGIVMGLWFDNEETLSGYYNMLRIILEQYGVPQTFYSDKRTVFEYKKSSHKSEDKDTFTQFARCCNQLGTNIITTSVPQAKGRIERLWRTLQSRLLNELARNKIDNIKDANDFLPEFTERFNREFALKTDNIPNVFKPSPSKKEINYYLSICYNRIIDNGASFSLCNQKYQLCDDNHNTIKISKGEKVAVYNTFDNQIVAIWNNKYYETKFAENPKIEFNKIKVENRAKWKPAPNHPWRIFVTSRL